MSIDFGKPACIHTNTFVNTTLKTVSPLSAAEKNCLFFRNNIPHNLAEMGKVSELWRFSDEGNPKT